MPHRIEIALLRLYAECSGALIVGQTHSTEVGGIVLRLSIEPPENKPPRPEGTCEEDVYDAVAVLSAAMDRRVTSKEVMAEMDSTNHLWGRSTVLNALAALVHKGLLINPHDKKGYGVPIAPDPHRSQPSP